MQPDGQDGPAPAAPHSGAPTAIPAVPQPGAPRPTQLQPTDGEPTDGEPTDGERTHGEPTDAMPTTPRPRQRDDGGPPTIEMMLDLDRPPGTIPVAEPAERPRRLTDTDHLGPPIGRHRASGRQQHWLAIAMVCVAVAAIAVAVIGGWGRKVPAPDTLPPSTGVPTVLDTDPAVVPGPTLTGPTTTATATTTPTRRATPSATTPGATPSPAPSTTRTTNPPPTTRPPTPSPSPTGPTVLPIPPHTVTLYAASGQCLDDSAQIQADGNRVQAWECNNTDAQHWTFGADGTMRYHSLCLRPAGTTAVSGALMQIRTCTGVNQVWQFRSDKSVYNPNTGMCLTDPGTDPHNQLTLSTCTGSARQLWTVV